MSEPIFNRAALQPMDILGSRSFDFGGWSICRATGGLWNHDATYDGNGGVCESIFRGGAQVRPLDLWEDECRAGRRKVIVLRMYGISQAQQVEGVEYFRDHILGRKYDWRAIIGFGVTLIPGILFGRHDLWKFGSESRFFCTEACVAQYHHGGCKPWWPKERNQTPGTTYKRTIQELPTFFPVPHAFTEYGKQFRIALP